MPETYLGIKGRDIGFAGSDSRLGSCPIPCTNARSMSPPAEGHCEELKGKAWWTIFLRLQEQSTTEYRQLYLRRLVKFTTLPKQPRRLYTTK